MLVRGPFDLKWNGNILSDVEEVTIDHDIEKDDYKTVQGGSYEIDGAYKAKVTITLLASDIPSLAVVLPQHFVGNGQVLSTGETVQHAQGAIDVSPNGTDAELIYGNLDIISNSSPGVVFRLNNARTRYGGTTVDGKILKTKVEFVGEPLANEATIQFFRDGKITTIS